jgi:hypothetical protein
MRRCFYIRNISSIERGAKRSCRELVAVLGISYTTLRRLRKGKPVTLETLRLIKHGLRKLKTTLSLRVETPDRVLKLALTPDTVRINRIDYIEPSSLITAEVLAQVIEGRAFTRTFERTLRAFLRDIVVAQTEYAISSITSDHSAGFVDEWKQIFPSLVEGDELRDMIVFLRSHFRSYIDLAALYAEGSKTMGKHGTVSVVELTIPIENMRALSAAEQNLLITFGQACNELAVLIRLAVFGAHHHDRRGRMYEAFAVSQQMTIMKLLAGKLHECWKLVRARYFGTGLSKKYDSIIMRETKADLKVLQRYFNRSSNMIARIRNEAAFHYSNADVRDAFRYVTGKHQGLVYMAQKRFYHELHFYAEVAMTGHLLGQVHKDRVKAIRLAQNDIAHVGTMLASVMGEILQEVRNVAIKINPNIVRAVIFPVELERRRNLTSIPIFIRTTEYNVEYLRLARTLGR